MISSDDREAWLAARRNYVTASDAAAVLGASEYRTREQVLLEKAGLADENPGDERMDLALALEPFVAAQAKLKFNWDLQKHGQLVVDPQCPYLAATPDYVMSTPWGDATVQVKVTASKPWAEVKKHGGQPPLMYQVQVVAECAALGYQHGVLLVLHLLPLSLRAYYVPRHEATVDRIRREAEALMLDAKKIREGKAA